MRSHAVRLIMAGSTRLVTSPPADTSLLARCYNNWVRNLVKGHEKRLLPVAIMPAGKPEAMADELKRCVNELL